MVIIRAIRRGYFTSIIRKTYTLILPAICFGRMSIEQKVYVSRHCHSQTRQLRPRYSIDWHDIMTHCRLTGSYHDIAAMRGHANWLLTPKYACTFNTIDDIFDILFIEHDPFRRYVLSILRPHVKTRGGVTIDMHEYWRRAERCALRGDFRHGRNITACIWHSIESVTETSDYRTLIDYLNYIHSYNTILNEDEDEDLMTDEDANE
jgi:hypothetical protein